MDYKNIYQEVVKEIMERIAKLESYREEYKNTGTPDQVDRLSCRIDELQRLKKIIDEAVFAEQEKV